MTTIGRPGSERERAWLAAYDPRAFAPIAVTVDVVALTMRRPPDGSGKALHVLTIRRGAMPYAGHRALPGGFVRAAENEDLDQAAIRELAEETGLAAHGAGGTDPHDVPPPFPRLHLEQLGTYGTPGRDPRMRVVSVAYLAFAPDLPEATAGGDAAAASWVPVDALDPAELAFDHARILGHGLERARAKLEYTPLATAFAGSEFTITELREVYEAVWGEPLHAGNFHRKVLSVPGFVEDTDTTTARGGARGGRRARLYRAGGARLLHPALLRPSREETQ
ncbi:NUDIX domain-containing protein [Yinghuangia sp. ASG 101]|uniref:NUDIX hydrolase n=1 Tax=Yinghuangia sp. ASG 101 TaxID=2896848 RepID=UPI001E2D8E81|nr:NUDIX domain-containing protein [Yinghuangia sp. ASG 101]UGQ13291.1 NUDIX domain-containing protein [Yinghuangia sp. ASG 101]